MNGYIPLGLQTSWPRRPDKQKITEAAPELSSHRRDGPAHAVETAEFWRPFVRVPPESIQAKIRPGVPPADHLLRRGTRLASVRDSSRPMLQWHWQEADGLGRPKSDLEIMSGIFLRIKRMYQTDGGKFPTLSSASPGLTPSHSANAGTGDGVQRQGAEGNLPIQGPDEKYPEEERAGLRLRPAARRPARHGLRLLDAAGCWTSAGNQMGRRDRSDHQTGIGQTLNWAWAGRQPPHPVQQPRLLRHQGQAVDPTRKLVRMERHQLGRGRHPRLQGG
ncbi:hypothetical protein [Duganella sp. BJB1802]|uniref:hypothetical protein n=1 Tax=Duganella sp. BJB1802 TaxID=2744575 RepID=UPI001E380BCC|nr:hypothetical protein [Duganella sp. BJB1802]